MRLVPLHIYSGYSFLQSGLSIPKIAALAKKYGVSAIGLSDKNSMSGLPELCHTLEKSQIQPIYGLDLECDGVLYSLYVENEEGYRNLMALLFAYSKGELTHDLLVSKSAGLSIVLNPDHSPIYAFYSTEQSLTAEWLLKASKGIEHFYLGVPYLPNDLGFKEFLREFAQKYPYQLIAFPHYLYEKKGDAIVLEILKAIADNEKIANKEKDGSAYFLSEEDIAAYYNDPEIEATLALAKACRFDLIQKRGGLLHFPCPDGKEASDYLRELSYEGLKKKNPDFGEEYEKRLDYELSVIEKMGYSDYFLIVSDYVNFCLSHDISVGPGRGSGAASLVSYSLGIIIDDPLKYDLIFERFLNPERKTMPDIDVDFEDIKREQVMDYIASRYGQDHVARVMTMTTIGARQSLHDIGRVYDYEDRVINLISKTIKDPNLSLRQDYVSCPAFKALVDSDPYYLEIVSLASKIEGLPRQSSLHASAVVINDEPLEKDVPCLIQEGLGYVVAYEGSYLEEQGFLKMDILGLRNLSTVKECLRLIKTNHGVSLEPRSIPWEEKEAIELIASGKTMGLFQLESPGMRRAIKEVVPQSFEDVIALLALYRPGPMDNIHDFAAKKNGKKKVSYLDPCLESILSPTYGVIVYQEQIMKIASEMAGFSFGQADLFRRAISKKNAQKIEALKADFIQGCLAKGHSQQVAEAVYALIYKFSDYGFNKGHAAAYAILTCQMAYLKAHYPEEFYAAILDFCSGEDDGESKFSSYLAEMKKTGLKLGLPDVNHGEVAYSVHEGKIIYPLSGIKKISSTMALDIVEERANNGPFTDLFDFALRMKKFGLKTADLVRLIDAGALDSLWKNRTELRLSAGVANNYAEMMYGEDGQQALLAFSMPKPMMRKAEDELGENLEAEREALGLMISGSPLDLHQQAIQEWTSKYKVKLAKLSDVETSDVPLYVAAAIQHYNVITSKRGGKICFVNLYDEDEELEGILYEEGYSKYFKGIQPNNVVIVKLKKRIWNDKISYVIEGLAAME